MDRKTDLTIDALVARDSSPELALNDYQQRKADDEREAWSHIGISRRRENDNIHERIVVVPEVPEDREIDFEQFHAWQRMFGTFHPLHVKVDPWSFIWGNDTQCDCCGCMIHYFNRPEPCYGVCKQCTHDMEERPSPIDWAD